jgi:archaeoflavoprotein AfpA
MAQKKAKKEKKRKVAWGITGGGDKLPETMSVMREIRDEYQDEVDIRVFLSKAGEQVAKWYRLLDQLKRDFNRVSVEVNSNAPFLAGDLQAREYKFLLVAPATSNTVAKIAAGVADTLLCNSVVMALKASVPVYIMPTDYKEGKVLTKLPSGRDFMLRVRKEDAENVTKLSDMDGLSLLEKPEGILKVFEKHLGSEVR